MKKILFVCLGNICRSPLAEGVFLRLMEERKVQEQFEIDSAGMLNCHIGNLPDGRMRHHAKKRGYELVHHARQVTSSDFEEFDLIVGMDDCNIDALKELAPTLEDMKKIVRMTDFCKHSDIDHVPDPYYGGTGGFEQVIDIVEDACEGLISSIQDN